MLSPRDFTNPVTGTTYRLRTNGATGWRVTKVCEIQGTPRLRHLRGTLAVGVPPPADAIDRLVRGEHQTTGDLINADPQLTFAEAVLLDSDRVSTLMTTLAAEARRRRLDGTPGFRPGCPQLRQQEREALMQATGACKAMATAWRTTGLGDFPDLPLLPEWLRAALVDEEASGVADT